MELRVSSDLYSRVSIPSCTWKKSGAEISTCTTTKNRRFSRRYIIINTSSFALLVSYNRVNAYYSTYTYSELYLNQIPPQKYMKPVLEPPSLFYSALREIVSLKGVRTTQRSRGQESCQEK